ncbi:MAG: hypothetical protein U5K79_07790 [Cyclobacteriaceae bacterium]|nr:hypothetical protein [Cyclobacteriaceae bacterium]
MMAVSVDSAACFASLIELPVSMAFYESIVLFLVRIVSCAAETPVGAILGCEACLQVSKRCPPFGTDNLIVDEVSAAIRLPIQREDGDVVRVFVLYGEGTIPAAFTLTDSLVTPNGVIFAN